MDVNRLFQESQPPLRCGAVIIFQQPTQALSTPHFSCSPTGELSRWGKQQQAEELYPLTRFCSCPSNHKEIAHSKANLGAVIRKDPSWWWPATTRAVQDAPAVMGNYEETIQDAKGEAWHSEEIHSSNGFTMILQEDSPALGWFRLLWCSAYPARDGSLRNIETQLEQLTMYARGTPGGILGNHAENQFSQLFTDSLPAECLSMARNPIPVQAESSAMPACDGLGSDDNQSLLPFRPPPLGDNPKQTIKSSEPRPRLSPLHGQKLLAKSQILQKEIASRVKRSPKQTYTAKLSFV
ncbi:MAG TPA: hypothetical protein VFK06_02725 [Candidatus Angelobacter sp.]|nr:hypothetical protein [Candidatus Angelobacter sp.]